jgi:hypothetical protein
MYRAGVTNLLLNREPIKNQVKCKQIRWCNKHFVNCYELPDIYLHCDEQCEQAFSFINPLLELILLLRNGITTRQGVTNECGRPEKDDAYFTKDYAANHFDGIRPPSPWRSYCISFKCRIRHSAMLYFRCILVC